MLRLEALTSLGQMAHLGTDAHPAVLLLIRCLDDPNLAPMAAKTLGRLRLESDVTVPALIECARSTNQSTRTLALSGLQEFGPGARAAVPELTKLLSDPDVSVCDAARNALRQIAPEVIQKTQVP
jgi:HEAT repeat protein